MAFYIFIHFISYFSQQLWLKMLFLHLFIHVSFSQAFTSTGVANPFSIRNKQGIEDTAHIQAKIASNPTVPEDIFTADDAIFTMDFETRQKRRLARLDESIYSSQNASVPPFHAGFLMENERQQQRQPLQYISETDSNHVKDTKKPRNPLGDDFSLDADQHNSILSDAPAILLQSGAGTGKSTVLSGKIAHLLRTKQTEPQNMIILSFTARDAKALKKKALQMLYRDSDTDEGTQNHEELGIGSKDYLDSNLWCGTIHAFAINILRKYNKNDMPLRVISSKDMKNRVRSCLGRINASNKDKFMRYKSALEDSNQSIGTLVYHLMRCLELWKEAGVLSTPYAYSIQFRGAEGNAKMLERDDYIELAMRLGIPQSAAILALDIADDYQTMHATMSTCDPSDVALIAHDFLVSNQKELKAVRSKLQQVIIDEYQDVSVSQHKLLRLIMLGPNEDEITRHNLQNENNGGGSRMTPVLLKNNPSKVRKEKHICYHVPKIICAGDCNQSIYGWRGAAPSLTVDGFRRDYPQGVVIPLLKNHRLPRHILNAANVLIGEDNALEIASVSSKKSFAISPAAATSAVELALENISRSTVDVGYCGDNDAKISFGRKLLVDAGVISESSSSVYIQGLFDAREESKYIANSIKSRFRARQSGFAKCFNRLEERNINEQQIYDSWEIAVMARSGAQLKMIEEALKKNGIPCEVPKGKKNHSAAISVNVFQRSETEILSMKPVKLITMHHSKGDEFDEVYLAGWTEGTFPHKASVSSNRLYEERRIAYVALTRARQRVVLTYSFFKRVPYFGADGKKKEVTEPVEPSRFLYDLVSVNDKVRDQKPVEWSEFYGFKETIASKNLPPYYANSYKVPAGYTKEKHSGKLPQSSRSQVSTTLKKVKEVVASEGIAALRAEVEVGLHQIFSRKWGVKGKFRKKFRCLLREYGIHRGTALILTNDGQKEFNKSVDALVHAPTKYITTRALSRCTAEQLGLYIIYLLHEDQ